MNYTYYRRYRPRQKRESFKPFFWLIVFLILSVFVFKACFNFIADRAEEKRDEAILSVNKGEAEITVFGSDEAEKASTSQVILEGDKVKSLDDSYVTLDFYNGTKVKLDQNTTLSFTEVESSESNDFIVLDLIEGRIWVDEVPSDEGQLELKVKTDVMNLISFEGKYLASNIPDDEYVYVFEDRISAELVDRSAGNDVVIENVTLSPNQKIMIPDSKQIELLERQPVTLAEDAIDELLTDDFFKWNSGSLSLVVETKVEDDEETSTGMTLEEITALVDEADTSTGSTFKIKVTSPDLNTTIHKDAIAIEGEVLTGAGSKVTVTWDGSGSAYTLAGFGPGDTSFRYVADLEYKNLKEGVNVYTVTAYDAAGNPSNTVTVTINVQL
jgi:hypothetical protein